MLIHRYITLNYSVFLAGMAGKMVILTLQPPTYEIFTMISRVLLVSGGRTMYSGKRRDMLPYFAAADYPCPAFKNPSDYYCKWSFNLLILLLIINNFIILLF